MNATLSIQKITPKQAQEMLAEVFEGQRNMRPTYVARLACDIAENRWRLSPDAILMVKGKLANGQHRLNAVIQANRACPFIVMETADDELYKIIDSGIKRTVADVLLGAANRNHLAAAARWVVLYDKRFITRSSLQTKGADGQIITRGEIVEYAQTHQGELVDCVECCLGLYRQKAIFSASQAAAIMHLALRKHPAEKVRQFFVSVYLGESREDAAWDIRERLIKNRSSSSAKLPATYIFGLTIKALRSYMQGTRPGVLKIGEGEEFPKL